MRFFEFLHPDKSPPNAQMPKRLNTLKRKKRQTTHTPHPHNKIPPKFSRMPPKFRQNHDCTLQVSIVHRCQVSTYATKHPEVSQYAQIQGFGLSKTPLQVSTYPTKHPEVSQCAKIRGFGLSKMTLQVSRCLPKPPTDTLQFLNLQNHLSRSQKITKRHHEFLYTHEVREFLTIQRPQCTRPNTHTTPPKSFGVSDSLRNPPPFKGKFHTLGSRPTHCPRHRERAVIRLCACRKMPNTLADVNLP